MKQIVGMGISIKYYLCNHISLNIGKIKVLPKLKLKIPKI